MRKEHGSYYQGREAPFRDRRCLRGRYLRRWSSNGQQGDILSSSEIQSIKVDSVLGEKSPGNCQRYPTSVALSRLRLLLGTEGGV